MDSRTGDWDGWDSSTCWGVDSRVMPSGEGEHEALAMSLKFTLGGCLTKNVSSVVDGQVKRLLNSQEIGLTESSWE